MTLHCKVEDKTATVIWQYPGDSEKKFTSNIVPIEVKLDYESTTEGSWKVDIYDDITTSFITTYNGTKEENPVVTSARELKTATTNRIIASDSNTSAGNVRIRSAVFTPSSQPGYRIKILDTSGKILFQDFKEGQAPKYTVACGDGCPPHHMKCECNSYPGYCCIPCKSTANRINNLAAKIENNG